MKQAPKNNKRKIIIPNSKFKDYKRNIKFAKQIKKDGFCDRETWSLDITIANWLLPKLKKSDVIVNKKDIENNEIIWFLELVAGEDGIFPIEEKHRERAYAASDLLGKNFFNLLIDKNEAEKLAVKFAKWLHPRFNRLFNIVKDVTVMTKEQNSAYQSILYFLTAVSQQNYNKNSPEIKLGQKEFGTCFLGFWW